MNFALLFPNCGEDEDKDLRSPMGFLNNSEIVK